MFSNKSESNISKRTRAICAIRDIGTNYDSVTSVLNRFNKHSDMSSYFDELMLIEALHKLNPFTEFHGRYHDMFPKINLSVLQKLSIDKLYSWLNKKKIQFFKEVGN